MSAELPVLGTLERVRTGRPTTSAGQSHSWDTPTRLARAPRAHTISVAAGSSETTRGGMGAQDSALRSAFPYPVAPRRGSSAMLRAFLCWLCLSASAAAQIDLPDRPVRPPPVSPPVEVPPPPKGDLADRVTGAA